MAIQSINPEKVSSSVAQTKLANKNTVETKDQAVGVFSGRDTVSITHGINNAADIDTSASLIDEKRVASIKEALQSGNYPIDPERVASKMMRFDQQLFTDTT